MHQTRKGQQWCFGMKLQIGTYSGAGRAHSVMVTTANVHDKHPLLDVLHSQEAQVHRDFAYATRHTAIRAQALNAQDGTYKLLRKGSATDSDAWSTAPNLARVPGLSIYSASSSAYGGSARSAAGPLQ